MNHKEAKKWLFHYLNAALPSEKRVAYEEHVSHCRQCRDEIAHVKKIQENVRTEPAFKLNQRVMEETLEMVTREYGLKKIPSAKKENRFRGSLFHLFEVRPRLKPALLLLALLLVAFYIFSAPSFSRPGGAFSFSVPVSILQPGEIS